MNQEELNFDKKLTEYGDFKARVGQIILNLSINSAENAMLLLRHRMVLCKNARRAAIELVVAGSGNLSDFRKEWPHFSDSELFESAVECVETACRHLEFLRDSDPSYQALANKQIERKRAIGHGDMSRKFPINFLPPKSREGCSESSAMPQADWIAGRMKKKKSRLRRLREEADKVSEMFDKRDAQKRGIVPKGQTKEFGFMGNLEKR